MDSVTYLLLLSMTLSVYADKILMVTVPVSSQCIMTAFLGQELVSRGHDVTVYFPDRHDPQKCFGDTNVTIRTYPILVEHQRVVTESILRLAEAVFDGTGGPLTFFKVMTALVGACCNPLLASDLDLLKKENYDLVVVNPNPPMLCLSLVPVYLGVPFVSLTTLVDPFDALIPFPSFYFPHALSSFPDTISFYRRFANTIVYLLHRLANLSFARAFDRGVTASLPISPSEAAQEASLYLEHSDHILDEPRAVFPNLVRIGGLTARPPRPLPTDLERFFQSARQGVIVVAFGSIIHHAPAGVISRLLDALKRLDYKVLLGHSENGEDGNVKMVTWIPQNDVLGHNKTRLFISHCGMGSYAEAVYHGVPIVCSPLNADAFSITERVVREKLGSKINILTDSSESIWRTLTLVLSEAEFKANAVKFSRLLRNRPHPPATRAALAIEEVLEFGGAHLRPTVAGHLSWVSYLMLDVWAAFFLIVFGVLTLPVCLIRRFCCRKKAEKLPKGQRTKKD